MNNMTEPLKALVDRISNVLDNVDDLKADLREIYAEAKGDGYNVAALRIVVREHRENIEQKLKRRQVESHVDLYRAALGMLDGTPLGDAATARAMSQPQPIEPPRRRGRPLGSKNRPKAPTIPITLPDGVDVSVSFAPPPVLDDEVF